MQLNIFYLLTLTLAYLSAATPAAETGAAAAVAAAGTGAQPPAPTSTSSSSSSDSDSDSSSAYQQCAKNILDACLSQMKPQMDKCSQNDWSCLCTQSKNMLTCYNDCPSDPNHTSADQQKMEYCNAAEANSLYSTSTRVSSSSSVQSTASATSSRTAAAAAASTSSSSGGVVAVGGLVSEVGMGMGMGLAGLVVALF
ncbi:hypothetical protein BDQ94DRAFT_173891 [Aspergillus welwitschiae]|uniref:GPI anchored serine-threonine rich protein n=1 Tax=Aspergillus welwitschiae TaxID=1341132 RepID=A0A3F3PRK4_9EURO|nr:hypothetical protein BDQ94DRAFT_173891 [Aspergillus welwitschiae]RDH29372.1 hypothetical protein BDQ94DRAFT_173891 [Aspergillus welwitschiae]